MGLLRFFYALSVVSFHLSPFYGKYLFDGKMSVQSFFIISGFYMALILNEKYSKHKNSYSLFIINRFLRIYPIYWIVLVLTAFVTLPNVIHLVLHRNILELFLKNFILFINPDYFFYDPTRYEGLFVYQSWTLGLELLFYLVAPFIVRKSYILIGLLLLLSLSIQSYLWQTHLFYPTYYFNHFILTEASFFILGVSSYKLLLVFRKRIFSKKCINSFFILLLIITFGYHLIPQYNHITEWGYYLSLTLLIPFAFMFSSLSHFGEMLGNLSYPIYISHTLLISFISLFTRVDDKEYLKNIIIISVIAISYLLHKGVQEKIDIYRRKRVAASKTL